MASPESAQLLQLLVTLIDITFTGMLSFNAYDYNSKSIADANCVASAARTGYRFTQKSYANWLDYEEAGCSTHGICDKSLDKVIAMANNPPAVFDEPVSIAGYGLVITGLCAIAAYLAFWAIGWLCAGFTRDA